MEDSSVTVEDEIHLSPQAGSAPPLPSYDVFLAAIGFESRARFIAETLGISAKRRVSCAFSERRELSFATNYAWFRDAGYTLLECDDDGAEESYFNELTKAFADGGLQRGLVRLCVDISSLSRVRMASLFAALTRARRGPVEVDFLYAEALYDPPSDDEPPIQAAGPVSSLFAGWSEEPEVPCVAIVGLGYERERAVGALELIEPATVWVFRPKSKDQRYDVAIDSANELLWDLERIGIADYAVDRPLECFVRLESLAYGALGSARPVIVPFGPKLFALNALLVAALHWPKVTVWRVSSGQLEKAVDRRPEGSVHGLRVKFDRRKSAESADRESESRPVPAD